jgi:hypothetical protein
MSALFFAASNDFYKLILSTRQHAPSIKDRLQLAYYRVVAHWTTFNLIEVLRHIRPQGIAAGLLVMAVFVGALDFAMKSSSATGNKAQISNSVPKFQDRPFTTLAGPRPLRTNPSQSKPALDLTEAEVFNVSGCAGSSLRTALRLLQFPDQRENTGKFADLGLR